MYNVFEVSHDDSMRLGLTASTMCWMEEVDAGWCCGYKKNVTLPVIVDYFHCSYGLSM